MTQTGKAVALISSFGAVGGIGAYAGGLFESKKDETKDDKSTVLVATVSNRLTDEGFEVLDTTKSDHWEEVFNVYKLTTTKNNLFSKQKEQITTIKELQEECAKIINKEKDTTNSYSLARQWCVKKENMETVLSRKKLKLLKADEPEESSEKQIWTEKVAQLIKNKEKFKSVNLNESEKVPGDNVKALKEGCKKLNNPSLFTTSDEFANNLELAKAWCTTNNQ